MKMTLAFSYGLFVTVCCCIRGVCQDKAKTTVFVQHGRTATLSWNLPKPEIREFTVRHSSDYLFHVTDYNKVKVNDEYTLRTIFRGNISASGSGVFSFQLFDAGIWSADGNYSCYSGSPGSRGTIIAECGQRLVVIHIQVPYIVTQDTAQPSDTANLTCHSIIRSSPVSQLRVSVTWRRNGIKLTIDGKYQVSVDYGWFSYHAIFYTNTLTIRKDKSEDNATYACQVEVLKHLFRSDWSLGYVLDGEYRAEGDTNYTVPCVGDNATVTWRVPQYGHLYHVKSDSGRYIFRLESNAIYVEYFYWLRIIITEVITSSAANVIRFLLYDVTVADAGRYFCESTTCEHVLIVARVPTKPKITTSIKPQVGQNVTLICSSTSRSLPRDHNLTMSYIWRRGSTRMLSGGRQQMVGSNLTINGFKRQDMGNYSCQATEEKGIKSEWSNNSVMEWPLKPEIMNLTVNGTFMITFSVNQTAKFTCVVEGYPPPHVHVVQVGSNKSSVGMLRRQVHVFDHVIHISSCSQFGQYFCRANNSMGTSEVNAHVATLQTLPRKRDSKDCEIENETDGKPPSGKVKFTICAYPEPVVTKWYFAKYGNPRDSTASEKYKLSTKPSTNNVYDFTLTITNITESDFGAYIFSFKCDEATTDVIIIASRPKENAGSSTSSIIIGCSIVAIALISIATVFLFRIEHIRDYWNIRFPQSFTTPTNNISVSLENMTDRGYDVIEDSHLSASIAVPGHRSVGSDVDYQEVRILPLSLELKNVDLESLDDLAIKEDETEKEKGSTSFGDEEEDECCEESVSDFAAGKISFPLTIADAFNTTVPETRSTVNETDELQTDILDQREVMPFPTTSSDTVLVLLNQVINESDSLLLYSTEGKHAADCVTSNEYEYLRRQAQNDEYTTLKQDHNPSDSELH